MRFLSLYSSNWCFFFHLQLLVHHIPPLPQPEIPQGAEASAISNSPWEFPRNRLDLQVMLGSGAFGVVMKAQAQGIKGCVGKMYVAVKIVKGKPVKDDYDIIANDFYYYYYFLFGHPHKVTITKDDFKMARKPMETTRLMQRGLSHLGTTNTIK